MVNYQASFRGEYQEEQALQHHMKRQPYQIGQGSDSFVLLRCSSVPFYKRQL